MTYNAVKIVAFAQEDEDLVRRSYAVDSPAVETEIVKLRGLRRTARTERATRKAHTLAIEWRLIVGHRLFTRYLGHVEVKLVLLFAAANKLVAYVVVVRARLGENHLLAGQPGVKT